MKKITEIHLIRHSKVLKIQKNVNENSQISNEKIILSIEGEKKAEELSYIPELQNIDILYSSNYVRAISTAKYIADKNNININIDENLGERKLGNLKELEILGKDKKHSFTTEQLIDKNLKNKDGESRLEAEERINKCFNKIFKENIGKKVAIVSHGAILKFLIMKWCKLNDKFEIEFNKNIIKLDSPGIIKLIFEDENFIELKNII